MVIEKGGTLCDFPPMPLLFQESPMTLSFPCYVFLNGAFLLFQKAVANEQSLGQIFSM